MVGIPRSRPPEVQRRFMFIGGEFTAAVDDAWLASEDPYTQSAWSQVPEASTTDVDRAVAAARDAFKDGSWRNLGPDERGRLLWALGESIENAADELGWIETCDSGKTFEETSRQAAFAGRVYRYYAGWCDKAAGRLVPMDDPSAVAFAKYEPRGVCALITAWNSPMQLLANKLPAALAAGNSVVVKPSELSPTSTLALAELIRDAGFPPGVVNIITGGRETGEALAAHEDVDMISVTGGLPTGRAVGRTAGENIRPAVMELGGKSPHIVFADCDLDRAIEAVIGGIFSASGQSCVAGSRLLVEEAILDPVIEAIVERVEGLRLGDPLDPETDMGPQANRLQHERVVEFLAEADDAGIEPISGGLQATRDLGGLFTAPTVFFEPPQDLRLCREEVFGPVLVVSRFRTETECLELANDSELGLAAGVHTSDLRRASRMVEGLDVGTVWVNMYRRSAATAPFGGEKLSGLGRERGWEGFLEYSRVKTVMIDRS